MTGFQKTFDNTKRIMATTTMTKAETTLVNFIVENRFDDINQLRLHDAVSNRRYS